MRYEGKKNLNVNSYINNNETDKKVINNSNI